VVALHAGARHPVSMSNGHKATVSSQQAHFKLVTFIDGLVPHQASVPPTGMCGCGCQQGPAPARAVPGPLPWDLAIAARETSSTSWWAAQSVTCSSCQCKQISSTTFRTWARWAPVSTPNWDRCSAASAVRVTGMVEETDPLPAQVPAQANPSSSLLWPRLNK
jgi:hypothetical protein